MHKIKKTQKTRNGLPLFLEPSNHQFSFQEFIDWIGEHRDFIQGVLQKKGGVLFRGFPVTEVQHFNRVIATLGLGKSLSYIGGDSPRIKVQGNVYTSTEAPPSFKIPLHNELSFVKHYPKHIYFFCQVPAPKGGETILADAREIYHAVDASVKQQFVEKKLCYTSRYFFKSPFMNLLNKIQCGHKSWIDVFETEEKQEVERKCQENDFEYKWNKNHWLEIKQTRPSVLQHHSSKEMLWFNQAHLYDFNPKLLGLGNYIGAKMVYCQRYMRLHEIAFKDGTPIPRKDLYHILDVLDQKTISFPWQKGDVLVLDNLLAMHGRAPFTGKRRILTALTG